MAVTVTKCILNCLDQQGKKATMVAYFAGLVTNPNAAPASTFRTAARGISSAAIQSVELVATDETELGTATEGPYDNAEDRAVLEFKGATSGLLYKITVPGPSDDIWLDDKETLDVEDSGVQDLIALMVGNAKGSSGESLVFQKGYRARLKQHKAV